MALSSLYTYNKEVMHMIEQTLLHIIFLLLTALIAVTIIAFTLIITIVVIIRK